MLAFLHYLIILMEPDSSLVVIAGGKLEESIQRSLDGLSANKSLAILGKAGTINTAISVCEIVKRKVLENEGLELKQENRIYKKEFGSRCLSCIEIKLSK